MAQDLKTRAERQLSLNQAAAADAAAALIAARADLDQRVTDPSAIPPEQWADAVGAHQHVELARAALAAELATQAGIRTRLAGVTSPADTDTYEAQLRASLLRQARLRVLLRQGREREVTGAYIVQALGEAVDAAAARVAASISAVAQGTADQAAVQGMLDALGQPPLSTVVADAAALRSGAAFTAARDRLAALLPDALLTRAQHRYAEAATLAEEALAFLATARTAEDRVAGELTPVSTVAAAEQAFRTALSALGSYVAAVPAELAAARATLEAVAATPDLTPAQVAALDPAHRADAITAAEAEQSLADAVAEITILQQALDDALLSARIDDPDSDPETDPDVVAARAALKAAAPQKALTDARAAYDQAARDALDAWEVEVPAQLWDTLTAFEAVAATLDRLASQPSRDALTNALSTVQNVFADALDDADVQLRRLQVATLVTADREARAHALSELAGDRSGQYARGDGPAGRTADQL
jgi:SWI/SNF-related matrix-associated actin-dependent regulator 1 of chromatin subfamily A